MNNNVKKTVCLIICLFITLSLCSCGGGQGKRKTGKTGGQSVNDVLEAGGQTTAAPAASSGKSAGSAAAADTGKYDVDLTVLSSGLVYTEVYNMVTTPEDYIGKTVKMNGSFSYLEDNGNVYYACIIADATACCSQGIEFVLRGEHKYPDDYPEPGEEITVTGVFDTYMEGEYRYCRLNDAVML